MKIEGENMKTQPELKSKTYFPGLNGIRFFASLMVFFYHAEMIKYRFGLPNNFHHPFFRYLGRYGVILFFVLSGFLITFLLLTEQNTHGYIDIKKFYIRRMLRIWPVYYLMLIMSLFILPHYSIYQIPAWLTASDIHLPIIMMCLFLLPNLAMASYPPIPFFAQSWSVGVEEQFYIIWPYIIKKGKQLYTKLYLIILLLYLLRTWVFRCIKSNRLLNEELIKIGQMFFENLYFDSLAIGALFAYLLIKKSSVIKLVQHRSTQIISYLLILTILITGSNIIHLSLYLSQPIIIILLSIFFGVFIFNVASNPKLPKALLTNPVVDYLGKISYGIYMYHSLFIVLTIKIMVHFYALNNFWLYIISFLTSIGISALSYEYLEKFFLRKKDKFAKILSTNSKK